jgi:ribosome-associated protein
LDIIADTRQKDGKHDKKHSYIENQGRLYYCKLPFGDYAEFDKLSNATKDVVKQADEINRQGKTVKPKLYKQIDVALTNEIKLSIDTKQDLQEVYSNVVQDHCRFRNEMLLAKTNEAVLYVLVEHSDNINTLEDVKAWNNPRIAKYCFDLKKKLGIFGDIPIWALYNQAKAKGLNPIRPPVESEQLYKKMVTIEGKYGTKFLFCKKSETGKRIVELLGGGF